MHKGQIHPVLGELMGRCESEPARSTEDQSPGSLLKLTHQGFSLWSSCYTAAGRGPILRLDGPECNGVGFSPSSTSTGLRYVARRY